MILLELVYIYNVCYAGWQFDNTLFEGVIAKNCGIHRRYTILINMDTSNMFLSKT